MKNLTEVKEQTRDFVLKTKEQVESGEITLDSVLEKSKSLAQQATEASKETLNNLKEQLEEKVVVEDPEDGQESSSKSKKIKIEITIFDSLRVGDGDFFLE